MCTENDKAEVILHNIKQDIESLKDDMREVKQESQESRKIGAVTLMAFGFTLIGIGLSSLPYFPSISLGWFLSIIGFAVVVSAIVFYIKHQTSPKAKKTRDD